MVSVDEDTYRQCRIRAAAVDTSVSALVPSFLKGLVQDRTDGRGAGGPEGRPSASDASDVFEDTCATHSGLKAPDSISRDALHDRHAVR